MQCSPHNIPWIIPICHLLHQLLTSLPIKCLARPFIWLHAILTRQNASLTRPFIWPHAALSRQIASFQTGPSNHARCRRCSSLLAPHCQPRPRPIGWSGHIWHSHMCMNWHRGRNFPQAGPVSNRDLPCSIYLHRVRVDIVTAHYLSRIVTFQWM